MNPVYAISAQIFLNQSVLSGSRFAFVLYAVHMQLSPVTLGILVALFSLAPAAGSVWIGKIVDRQGTFGLSRVFTIAILGGAILPYFTSAIPSLMIAAPLIGGGFFALFIAMSTLVNSHSDSRSRSRNFALMGVGASLGHGFGPMIAGLCIDYFDREWALLALAILPLVSLVIGEKFRDAHGPPLGGLPPGKVYEAESWRDLLRMSSLRHVYWVSVLFIVALDVFIVVTPIYGSMLQLSASQMGLLVSAFALASLLTRLIAGPLSKKFSAWQILLLALACTGVGLVSYSLANAMTGLLISAFMVGFGQGMGAPMSSTVLYEVAPKGRQSEAMGLRFSLGMAAQTVQPLLSGFAVLYFSPESVLAFAGAILVVATFLERAQWGQKGGAGQ